MNTTKTMSKNLKEFVLSNVSNQIEEINNKLKLYEKYFCIKYIRCIKCDEKLATCIIDKRQDNCKREFIDIIKHVDGFILCNHAWCASLASCTVGVCRLCEDILDDNFPDCPKCGDYFIYK